MPSISDAISVLERLQGRNLSIEQHRCVRVRNRNATCMRCAEACTSGCIRYEDNEILVDPSKCTGCGTCATACPTCAIEAHRPDDDELARACLPACIAAGGQLVIADERICSIASGLFDERMVVTVKDLGRIDESLLVWAALAGAEGITLVHGPRDDEEQDTGVETARAVCDTANTLLDAWGCTTRVRIAGKLPRRVRKGAPAEFDAARRAFFRTLRDETHDAAGVVGAYAVDQALDSSKAAIAEPRYPKVGSDGTLPHFLPRRRKRLLGALRQIGNPDDVLVETRLWGNVVVDAAKCSGCRMCATFCPTGALAKFADGPQTGVEHVPAACVKCRCCEDICPERAISISDDVFATDLTDGARERIAMPPEPDLRSNPHSIEAAMRALLNTTQVFER